MADVPEGEKNAEVEEEDDKENEASTTNANAVAKVEEEKVKPGAGGVMTADKIKEMRKQLEKGKIEIPDPMVTLDASNIVFEEFTRVLHAVIGTNPGKNLKLKRLAVY